MLFTPKTKAEAFAAVYESLAWGAGKGRIVLKIRGGWTVSNCRTSKRCHMPGSKFVETDWAGRFEGTMSTTPSRIKVIKNLGVQAPIGFLDRGSGGTDLAVVPVSDPSQIKVPAAMLKEYGGIANLTNFKIPGLAGYTGAVKRVVIGPAIPDGKAAVLGPGCRKTRGFLVRLPGSAKGMADAMGERLVHICFLTDTAPPPVPGAAIPRKGHIGIFDSRDMVAVDQACVDAL